MAYETANKKFQKLSWEIMLLELGMDMPEITNKAVKRHFKKLATEKNEELWQIFRADFNKEEEKEEV